MKLLIRMLVSTMMAVAALVFLVDGLYAFTPLTWNNWRCMIAVGSFAGDSLRDGEPRCQVHGKPLRPLPTRRR